MSHEISIQNGVAEMFSGNNVVPWHKLGQVVSGLLTAKQAIEAARMDWQVKPFPVTVNGIQLPFPDENNSEGYQGICRADTGACLGIVKGRYEPIQNADCFDFMDSLVQDGKLEYETAGVLRGGRQIWLMAKYNGDIEIAGDKHKQWLLCVSSHDSSYSLMVQWVTERVVCANTLSIALQGKSNQTKIRHVKNWKDKATEASRVLGLTQDYFADMRRQLAALQDRPFTAEDMDCFTKLLFPAKDEKEVPSRTANIRSPTFRAFR